MFYEQVKWCSSACSHNKTRQTKIAHASALSFQGFSHKLFCKFPLLIPFRYSTYFGFVMFVVLVTGFRHGSLSCPSSSFIHFVPFHPLHPLRYLHWVSFHFIHFSSFQSTGCQLFSSPAESLGLRAFLFFNCDELRQQKCTRVVEVWHSIRKVIYCFCHTLQGLPPHLALSG